MMSAFFSNQVFLNYAYTFFRHNAIVHLIDYMINISFICPGKPKNSYHLLYFDTCFITVVWNPTCTITKVCMYNQHKIINKLYLFLPFAAIWMSLESIMLCEIS